MIGLLKHLGVFVAGKVTGVVATSAAATVVTRQVSRQADAATDLHVAASRSEMVSRFASLLESADLEPSSARELALGIEGGLMAGVNELQLDEETAVRVRESVKLSHYV